MPGFVHQYKELEDCFRKQVKRDRKRLQCYDIVFLPSFTRPSHRVDCFFIAMEPSLTTKWAGKKRPNRKDGEAAVKEGFRNFMPGSTGVCILHYCAKKYLCSRGQTYYITDMSKGAMPVGKANSDREERWEKWFHLLEKELELVAKKDATVFAIGRKVEKFLTKKREQEGFDYRLKYLLHYSGQAARYRKDVVRKKSEFAKFKKTVTKEDLIKIANQMLSKEDTEWAMKSKKRLKRIRLTDSWKMLIFYYKSILEGCR